MSAQIRVVEIDPPQDQLFFPTVQSHPTAEDTLSVDAPFADVFHKHGLMAPWTILKKVVE